jgi:hypothetical protein
MPSEDVSLIITEETSTVVTTTMEDTVLISTVGSSTLLLAPGKETSSIITHDTSTVVNTLLEETSLITTQETSTVISTPSAPLWMMSNSFFPRFCSNTTGTGTFCNTSNTPCDLLQPCLNVGRCTNTNSTRYGYVCRCPSQFNGTECQQDHRPCQPDTCWNQGEIVPSSSRSSV